MEKTDRDASDDIRDTENNEYIDSSEKLLVLPLGEESKKITQVIANDTARHIIELLAEHSMSASDIANQLSLPLTTIKYNIENLVDAGLIKIERIKYSEKGRQVKIYAPVRKLIVVVPEKTDSTTIADVLKKYLGVILASVFASGFIELLTGRYSRFISKMMVGSAPTNLEEYPSNEFISAISDNTRDSIIDLANETAQKSLVNDTAVVDTYVSDAVQEATEISSPIPAPTPRFVESINVESVQKSIDMGLTSHPGLWFLFGCLFIITVIMIVDYYRLIKKK